MSYSRVYEQRINWENLPKMTTPIDEVNLNKMDAAIFEMDLAIEDLDITKANQEDVNRTIIDVTYLEDTLYVRFMNGDLRSYKIPPGSGETPLTERDFYIGTSLSSAVAKKMFFIHS